MPRILSFGNTEKKLAKANPFKFIWEWILSLDKFTKLFLIIIVLISGVTPAIVSSLLIFNPDAATTSTNTISSSQVLAPLSTQSISPKSLASGASIAAQTYTVDAEIINNLDLLNQYRSQNGLGALTPVRTLTDDALWFTNDMASKNYWPDWAYCHDALGLDFIHCDSLRRDFVQRMNDFGYNFNTWKAENLTAGRTTGQEAFDSWKLSPEHNANMLNPNFNAVGIYRAYNSNSVYKWYWAQEFGGTIDTPVTYVTPTPVNQPPVGTTDSITNTTCRVQGWAFDPDTPSTNVAIHVYRDGQAGSGAAGKSSYTANVPREPAVGNHGFDITFDPSGDAFDQGFFDGATHTIYVYAIDTAGGTNPLLGMTNNISRNITCSPPPPLPPHSKGDVNCDNKITSVDALLILKTVAEIPVTNTACAGGGIDEAAAHVDADKDIDAVDALRVLQQIAGMRQIGSASFNAGFSDSDGDQIADSQEAQYSCMNPNVADANSDYDGDSIAGIVSMNNISEFAIGTNPCIADIDKDGYKDGAEFWIGTNPNKACATGPDDIDSTKPGSPSKTWPADLNTSAGVPSTYNRITLQDLTSFQAPIRRINTSPGDDFWVNGVRNQYDRRWDLVPGKGLFSKDINVQDITNLSTLAPPMFNGQRAFNGPVCTQ